MHFPLVFATLSICADGVSRKSIGIAESLQLNGNLLQARIISSRSMNMLRIVVPSLTKNSSYSQLEYANGVKDFYSVKQGFYSKAYHSKMHKMGSLYESRVFSIKSP